MTDQVFYDTEFLENGKTIKLISIGMTRLESAEKDEHGQWHFEWDSYYAVNVDAPWEKIHEDDFLKQQVVPHLPLRNPVPDGELSPVQLIVNSWYNTRDVIDRTHADVKPKWVIANEVRDWLRKYDVADRGELQLWADYSAYDHVLLAQLWGKMLDLPSRIPMRTNDLRQFLDAAMINEDEVGQYALEDGYDPSSVPFQDHHALSDAKECALMHFFLSRMVIDREKGRAGYAT